MHELLIASIDRAGDHAGPLGLVFLLTAVGGLVYLAIKSRGPGT